MPRSGAHPCGTGAGSGEAGQGSGRQSARGRYLDFRPDGGAPDGQVQQHPPGRAQLRGGRLRRGGVSELGVPRPAAAAALQAAAVFVARGAAEAACGEWGWGDKWSGPGAAGGAEPAGGPSGRGGEGVGEVLSAIGNSNNERSQSSNGRSSAAFPLYPGQGQAAGRRRRRRSREGGSREDTPGPSLPPPPTSPASLPTRGVPAVKRGRPPPLFGVPRPRGAPSGAADPYLGCRCRRARRRAAQPSCARRAAGCAASPGRLWAWRGRGARRGAERCGTRGAVRRTRSAAGAGPAAARRGATLPCAGRGTARTGAEPPEERGGEGEGWLQRVGGWRGGGKVS